MENNLGLGAHFLLDFTNVILKMLFTVAISHSIDVDSIDTILRRIQGKRNKHLLRKEN